MLVSVGVVAGGINAVAGGGAIIIFPALLGLGLSPISAAATISMAVLPGLVGSLKGYEPELHKVPRSFLLLIIPCLLGSVLGARLLSSVDAQVFSNVIPWLVLSAVMLLFLQSRIHKLIVTDKYLVKTNKSFGFPLMTLMVFILSIYGGFFGVGVGLMLLAVVGLSSQLKNTYQLSALKAWYVVGIATIACIYFLTTGLLSVGYGLVVAAGTAVGGYFGARYSRKISSHTVHNLAVFLGILITFYLFIK